MLLEGIYTLLSENSGVTGLNATVCPGLAPKEQTLPVIVMKQVGGEASVTSFAGSNALQTARIRFSCYGSSFLIAKQVARAVKFALDGLLATLSDGTQVEGAWLAYEGDQVDEALQGTVYETHVDFRFQFVDNDS
jgi:hypothetical protein